MNRCLKRILSAKFNCLALGLLTLSAPAAQPVAMPANLPLYFEASPGQAGVPAQFIARGPDYQFLIAPAEAQIVLRKTAAESTAVRMQFVGANAQAPVSGDAELPGKINYLTGNGPAQWRTGLAMFAKVRVGELYPGVNLVYYGNQRQLEYDFMIAPGANPDVIAIHFDGVDKISVNPQGELILNLAGGEIRQPKPVIYQVMDGVRKEIEGGYRMADAHTVAFVVGKYDHHLPLVIDPVLAYSTYIGGSAGETAYAVALDANGNVYMAGQTFSTDLSTSGAFQTSFAGGKLSGDAFIFKLEATNGLPAYITYLGGSGNDAAYSIAVDSAGNAYVAGATDSTNFPTTNAIPGHTNISGVFDPVVKLYPSDAFVAELDASGSNLVYSTYLGGSGADAAYGVAVDSAGHAFVTGFTFSTNFPYTANAKFKKLQCTNSFYFNCNAFVTEVASNGGALVYSTYFGGTNYDIGKGIAVDPNGFVYVTGFTASTNFPAVNAVVQQLVWTHAVGTNQISITNSVNGYLLNGSTNKTSSFDAFVAKFDPIDTNGTKLSYSTFLGGTNNDAANGVAFDNNGAAYVTGWTVSTNFPNTSGTNIAGELHSFVATNTSGFLATNVFLTKIVTNGASQAVIAWSAVFGGKGVDIGNGVAVDANTGNAFVTGSASSTNFPTLSVPTLMRYTNSGKSDAFVIGFTNTTANTADLLYSTYLGGKENDFGYGIAVDSSNNVYVVGQTLSTNFLTLSTNSLALVADYPSRNGSNDAFLAKITLSVTAPEIDTPQPASQSNAVGSSLKISVGITNGTPPFSVQWQMAVTNLVVVTNNQVITTNEVVTWTNLVNGGNISGATTNSSATNATLTINPAQTTNSGSYTVIVTNYGGAVTSSPASLSITNIPPAIAITGQPTSQTNGVGTTAIFSVTATGTPPLSYQWKIGGTNLVNGTSLVNGVKVITSGATSNVLVISNVQTNNDGNYTVVVTNFAGSVTSSVALLTVYSTPVITVQPTGLTNAVGATETFSVTAFGTVPLHYRWQVNGANLVNGTNLVNGASVITSGATNTNLIIINAQTNNSGNYTVIVTNIAGSVTSSVALLTVTNIPPQIGTQPASQTNGVGTTVTLTVTVTKGTPPLRYQWQRFGTNLVNAGGHISGATTNVLIISTVQTNDSGNYTVTVTGPGGSVTSSVAVLTVQTSPVITKQPISLAIAAGSTASFTVNAVGTVPLSYQWLVNGTSLVNGTNVVNGASVITSGATTTNLTISSAQTNNSGSYTVIVTNIAGSVTSSVAALTVTNIQLAITRQPTNQTVVVGTTVQLAVTATGTAPLSYQWQVGGTNVVEGSRIGGAISNVLTIKPAQTNNSGNYTVIVTYSTGSVTSSVAILTVASSPVIINQPIDQTVALGSDATFTVKAIGTVPLGYQWRVNGTNLVNGGGISGATTTNLTVGNVPTNYSGNSYSVIVTNQFGSATSSNALLTVATSPVIIVQPTNQSMAVGSRAALVVTAIGIAPLSYQWQMEGTNLVDETNLVNGVSVITSGTTTNVLIINQAQTNNTGNYTVIVTNVAGSVTSSVAALTVTNIPPHFSLQPTNQTVWVGSTVAFVINGYGTTPVFFQWQKDGMNLVDGTNISGSIIGGTTNVELDITNAQTSDSGNYLIIVTNPGGSLASSNAVLTVLPPPLFGNIIAAGDGSFILSGTGGESNGTYYVLTSSNLLLPPTNWTYIATDHFDGTGGFIFTNTAQTNAPQEFYLLQMP
jgi:lipocalin